VKHIKTLTLLAAVVASCAMQPAPWLTMADGHMFRLDPTHHLANMDGFMKSIANLPHDVVVIPCPAQL
jgi:hypothetical protein